MTLGELIQGTEVGPATPEGRAIEVLGITEDSREVRPGCLFIARPGLRADGRAFIADASRAGAVAVLTDRAHDSVDAKLAVLLADDVPGAGARLAERFFGEPSRAMRVVGVTGTNGKSTVVHLTRAILDRLGVRCGLIGTVEIDDGGGVRPAAMTTPPAVEVSRLLAQMRDNGCRAVAMEVSSHALDQRRVAGVRFDVGVFTNLTGDHLDYHRTLDAYADAKAQLFASLDDGAVAVVNADDAACAHMVRACVAPIMRCSLVDADALTAGMRSPDGRTLRARGPWGGLETSLAMPGAHNAMNLLQALVAAWRVTGAGPEELARAASDLRGPTGRMQAVHAEGDAVRVFVDFAHTDDALRHALIAARELAGGGRVSVVFGCGGERDESKRPRMGAVAAELADRVCVTSDNPRRETPSAIMEAILEGVPSEARQRIEAIEDRARAIEDVIGTSEAGDVVVIAGKGHEREQILPDGSGGVVRRAFDDAEHARRALHARGEAHARHEGERR